MPGRGRVAAFVGVAALLILTGVGVVPPVVGILAFVAAFAYAGYWGLAVRRGLVVPQYRNQALAASFPGLYNVLLSFVTGALPVSQGSERWAIVVSGLVDFGLLLVLLYWVNATVSIARRSDPLERDTFRFSAVRYIWALLLIAPAAFLVVYNPIALVYTVASPLDPLSLFLADSLFLVLYPFGAAILFVSASRSRDRTLRNHVRWFAAALAFYILVFAGGSVWRATGGFASGPEALLIDVFFLGGQFIVAYCFYRSAKSLAPITKTL